MLGAHLAGDDQALAKHRAAAVAMPGASVDAFARIALVMAPGSDTAALIDLLEVLLSLGGLDEPTAHA